LDLYIENGQIIQIKDRSKYFKKKRGIFKKRYNSGKSSEMVEEAFSLSMDIE